MVLGLEKEMYKMTLGHSCAPESKEVNHINLLKIKKVMLKEHNNLNLQRRSTEYQTEL